MRSGQQWRRTALAATWSARPPFPPRLMNSSLHEHFLGFANRNHKSPKTCGLKTEELYNKGVVAAGGSSSRSEATPHLSLCVRLEFPRARSWDSYSSPHAPHQSVMSLRASAYATVNTPMSLWEDLKTGLASSVERITVVKHWHLAKGRTAGECG